MLLLTSVAVGDEQADVADLAAMLKSDDPLEAAQAARSLGELGGDAALAVPQLIEALSDQRLDLFLGRMKSVAGFAADALVAIGPPAVPALVDELNSATDKDIRYRVISTLSNIGPPAKESLAGLMLIVESDGDESIRHIAFLAYYTINIDEEERIAILEKSLTDHSPQLRTSAAQYLGFMGEKAAFAVPALMDGLDDHDTFAVSYPTGKYPVRRACIEALGNIGPKAREAKGRLIEIMKSDNGDRIAAALAVLKIEPGNDEAMALLISQLNEMDEEFFGTSLNAGRALAQLIPQDDRALDALTSALNYPNDEYRTELVRDIGMIRDKKVVPLLTMVLKGLDDEIDDRAARTIAAESLGELGELAAPAVPVLVEVLYDNFEAETNQGKRGESSETVFWEAAMALGKIGPAAKSALDDLDLIRRSLDDDDSKKLIDETIERINREEQP